MYCHLFGISKHVSLPFAMTKILKFYYICRVGAQFSIFSPAQKTSVTILLVKSAKIFIRLREKSGSYSLQDLNMRMLGLLLNFAQDIKKFVSHV